MIWSGPKLIEGVYSTKLYIGSLLCHQSRSAEKLDNLSGQHYIKDSKRLLLGYEVFLTSATHQGLYKHKTNLKLKTVLCKGGFYLCSKQSFLSLRLSIPSFRHAV